MSESPAPLPTWPEVPHAIVRWRLAKLREDRNDEDYYPDWTVDTSKKVTIIPSVTGLVVYTPDEGDPITFELEKVTGNIDNFGYLVNNEGDPIRVAASDDPRMSVQGWTWSVEGQPGLIFATKMNQIVDISDFIIAPAVDATKFWVEKIPELVDLVGTTGGIKSVQVLNGNLVFTFKDDTVTSVPLPGATWDNIADKPSTFPAQLPLATGRFLGAEEETHGYWNGEQFRISSGDSPLDYGFVSQYGVGVSANDGGDQIITRLAYGSILVGPPGAIDAQTAVFNFPVEEGGYKNVATREWVMQNGGGNTNVVRSPGTPFSPSTTIFSQQQLGAMPEWTVFESTDGGNDTFATKFRKVRGDWVIVEGDTLWRNLMMTSGNWSANDGRVLVRRVDNMLHFRISGVPSGNVTAYADFEASHLAFRPVPFRMPLVAVAGMSAADGDEGGFFYSLPGPDARFRLEVFPGASGVFGSIVVPHWPVPAGYSQWPDGYTLHNMGYPSEDIPFIGEF